MIISQLSNANLENRFVFLRADLNVPHKDSEITDDFRLRALLPTLDLLLSKKARVIIGTHFDRPQGSDKHLSTKLLLPWFHKKGYPLSWGGLLEEADALRNTLSPASCMLLENLRFYEDEQKPTIEFAQQLKLLTDYYVNDAFGVLHRTDCSITLLPSLYAVENKTIGLLVEREIRELSKVIHPKKPLTLIMGGAKIKDKIPFINDFLKNIDTLILLPALSSTFQKSLEIEVGLSLVEDSYLQLCKDILKKAHVLGIAVMLPRDFLISDHSIDGKLSVVEKVLPEGMILAVGPQSLEDYKSILSRSSTIFLNGAMGIAERPETMKAFDDILRMITETNAFSVVGGGDSIAAVDRLGLGNTISFCSTGGGAMLHFLTHRTFKSLEYITS